MKRLILPCIIVFAAITFLPVVSSAKAQDKTLVGCYYFPGWYRKASTTIPMPKTSDKAARDEWMENGEWSEWKACIAPHPYPRPLLGFYDDSKPEVWDYELNWASEHGIDYFMFDWYYNAGEDYISKTLDKGYFGSKERSKVKFALNWCNHWGYWWSKPIDQTGPELVKMIEFCCENYFKRPEYLKIDGKPVFMIYDQTMLFEQNYPSELKKSFDEMQKVARKAGFKGLYLMANYPSDDPAYIQLLKDVGYDSFAAYTYCFKRGPYNPGYTAPYTDVLKETNSFYPFLSQYASRIGLAYVPAAAPGWDSSPRAGKTAYVITDNSPRLFRQQCEQAKRFADPKLNMVLVEAWNEWGEGACVAPERKFGFGFLDALRDVFLPGSGAHEDKLPSQDLIDSWSILNKSELEAAKAAEKTAWDLPPVKKVAPETVEADPKGQMSWDFSREADRKKLELFDVKPLPSTDAYELKSEGPCNMSTSRFKAPVQDVEAFTIKIAAKSAVKQLEMRIFWQTTASWQLDNYFSTMIPICADGKVHTYRVKTADLRTWKDSKGDLVALRPMFFKAGTFRFEKLAVEMRK